jgi:hypothetical protein
LSKYTIKVPGVKHKLKERIYNNKNNNKMKDPLKACTCEQCSAKKAKMATNVRKFFKRYTYKKLRKMDLEYPEYINFYYA